MLEATKKKIENLKINTNEIIIDFSNEDLGDEGARLLADALQGRDLLSLNLANSKITDAGFEHLIPVINSSANLMSLNLSGLVLNLSPLVELRSLANLWLDKTGMTDNQWPGLKMLLENNSQLSWLSLNNNPIFPENLSELQQNKWIGLSISLRECNLTLENVRVFYPSLAKNYSSLMLDDNKFFTPEELKEDYLYWELTKHPDLRDELVQQAIFNEQTTNNKLSALVKEQEIKIKMLEAKLAETKSLKPIANKSLTEPSLSKSQAAILFGANNQNRSTSPIRINNQHVHGAEEAQEDVRVPYFGLGNYQGD